MALANKKWYYNVKFMGIIGVLFLSLVGALSFIVKEEYTLAQERKDLTSEVQKNFITTEAFKTSQDQQDKVMQIELRNLSTSVDTLRNNSETSTALLYKIAGKLEIRDTK